VLVVVLVAVIGGVVVMLVVAVFVAHRQSLSLAPGPPGRRPRQGDAVESAHTDDGSGVHPALAVSTMTCHVPQAWIPDPGETHPRTATTQMFGVLGRVNAFGESGTVPRPHLRSGMKRSVAGSIWPQVTIGAAGSTGPENGFSVATTTTAPGGAFSTGRSAARTSPRQGGGTVAMAPVVALRSQPGSSRTESAPNAFAPMGTTVETSTNPGVQGAWAEAATVDAGAGADARAASAEPAGLPVTVALGGSVAVVGWVASQATMAPPARPPTTIARMTRRARLTSPTTVASRPARSRLAARYPRAR
jgi:hypothetical protein